MCAVIYGKFNGKMLLIPIKSKCKHAENLREIVEIFLNQGKEKIIIFDAIKYFCLCFDFYI